MSERKQPGRYLPLRVRFRPASESYAHEREQISNSTATLLEGGRNASPGLSTGSQNAVATTEPIGNIGLDEG